MTDGISALEGFDYQTMVALELMLDHFQEHGSRARARPEGVDDLDLRHTDEQGSVYLSHVQVKKPRQDANGVRTPSSWSLGEVTNELLLPHWARLNAVAPPQQQWILGDELALDAAALLQPEDEPKSFAAQRGAAELIARAGNEKKWPRWESPLREGKQPLDSEASWTSRFRERMRALEDVTDNDIHLYVSQVASVHSALAGILRGVRVSAPYSGAPELRHRLVSRLTSQYELSRFNIEDIVFRNLRGFVDDIARARGKWIDQAMLEEEMLKIWPRRVATVLPPEFPRPHLPRPTITSALLNGPGSIIGPSGSGKTTAAAELFQSLRQAEPDTLVLYAEVRSDTTWRNVLEGVAVSLARAGAIGYGALPSVRDGDEQAVLRFADTVEGQDSRVALMVDLVDGGASPQFVRDAARFAQQLPPSPKTRLWLFGQEDPLAELAGIERQTRRLNQTSLPGLAVDEFLALAKLHGFEDLGVARTIHTSLGRGRDAGVAPRLADAVLRTNTPEQALAAADSPDVLLAADTNRYVNLEPYTQTALGALACLSHPFSAAEAELTFPELRGRAAIGAGLRTGLLHSLGGGRFEFHETVRRNVLTQLPLTQQRAHNLTLADWYAARGDRVLEAHHADIIGLDERAKEAGRAAFLDPATADRCATRVVARKWVSPEEVISLLKDQSSSPHGWWLAIEQGLNADQTSTLLEWWRSLVNSEVGGNGLWQIPRVLLSNSPDVLPMLMDVVASSVPTHGDNYFGANALGVALRRRKLDETIVLERYRKSTKQERAPLAHLLAWIEEPRCLAEGLVYFLETDTVPPRGLQNSLTREQVLALIAATPQVDPSQHLLLSRDWGFGQLTSLLLGNAQAVGDAAFAVLQEPETSSDAASVALRLLGVTGRDELFEAARKWARKSDTNAQTTALIAPLLANEGSWRNELVQLVADAALEDDVRVAAFSIYAMSSDDAAGLLETVAQRSPNLESKCRAFAALAFMTNPTLFNLEMLVDLLKSEHTEPAPSEILDPAILRAAYFADGPHAQGAANKLVALLDSHSPTRRMATLLVLTRLRQPVACAWCLERLAKEPNKQLRSLAALAAVASDRSCGPAVRSVVDGSTEPRWLSSVMAARLNESDSVAALLKVVANDKLTWAERRRAVLSLKGLPYDRSVSDAMQAILDEPSLLGRLDSPFAHCSAALARLLQESGPSLTQLSRSGITPFIDDLTPVLEQIEDFYAPTAAEINNCLTETWTALDAARASGATENPMASQVVSRIHHLQLQLAALMVAAEHSDVEVLERVLATSDVPWLVHRALAKRSGSIPRGRNEATYWLELVKAGPLRASETLRTICERVLGSFFTEHVPPPASALVSQSHTISVSELVTLLDEDSDPPPNTILGPINADELPRVFARLDPASDSHVEVSSIEDVSRTTLESDGVRLKARPTTHRSRNGHRAGFRCRLIARFPDQVPTTWYSKLNNQRDIESLVWALATEGSPAAALKVLPRLPNNALGLLHPRHGLGALGTIADAPLVDWFSKHSSAGAGAEVARLTSFANTATPDNVVPLLSNLIQRLRGHFRQGEITFLKGLDDPWLIALSSMLKAVRLTDVPGASEWLHGLFERARDRHTRTELLHALARFPSAWLAAEQELMNHVDYACIPVESILERERLAHQLFFASK